MELAELEKRLATLKQDKETLWQTLNQCLGAIQECEHWIAEVKKTAEKGAPEASPDLAQT